MGCIYFETPCLYIYAESSNPKTAVAWSLTSSLIYRQIKSSTAGEAGSNLQITFSCKLILINTTVLVYNKNFSYVWTVDKIYSICQKQYSIEMDIEGESEDYINIYIYIYIYIYNSQVKLIARTTLISFDIHLSIYLSISLSLSLYIYIYIYILWEPT